MSSPELCSDCMNILSRVEQLELGCLPEIDNSEVQPDPEWSRSFEQFSTTIQFKESYYYKHCLPEDDSLEHKSTRANLLESAKSGCHLCQWLLNSLDSRSHMSYSTTETQYRRRTAIVRKDPSRSPLGIRCVEHYYVTLRCAPNERVWPVDLKRVGTDTRRSACQSFVGDEKASLIIHSLRDISEECPEFIGAIADLDAGSPSASTWKLFESWLHLCTADHPECMPHSAQRDGIIERGDADFPTRLLDVQDSAVVRVVRSDSYWNSGMLEAPHYATLSHCWGNTHEPQLNLETSDSFAKGIRLLDLPNTFKDAVIVCQRLKIPYLWIDSLCILQDSTEDWLKESSKMGAIYKNSYLCIAATVGKDNSSGFLERRDLTHKRPFIYHGLAVLEDVAMPNNNLNMRQMTWCDRMRTLVGWGVENALLNQRAWVFQERLFAPRILHCTSDEFIWECCRGMRSESHPLLTNGGSVVKDAWRQLLKAPPTHELQLRQRLAFLERWSELIATYSKAQLTRMDDRLIACSAITKEMQPILGNYAAGLWTQYMPSQLLWFHHRSCGIREPQKHTMRPRTKPSWSWGSLDCRVELPHYYDSARDPDFPSKTDRSRQALINLDRPVLIEILDINVQLRGDDSTGLVDGGSIRLRGGQLFPLYRSVAFGWRLETEAPGAFEQIPPVRWYWDDPNDFDAAPDKEIRRIAYTAGEFPKTCSIHRPDYTYTSR